MTSMTHLDLTVRVLPEEAIADARCLCHQVGWPVPHSDWERHIRTSWTTPLGGWVGEDLVAVGTVVHPAVDLAWIGLIAVEATHRRQGHGTTIFDRLLAHADASRVGLDASGMGKSMYRAAGFEEVCDVSAFVGELSPAQTGATVEYITDPTSPTFEAACALDVAESGVDRRRLLHRLLSEPSSAMYVARMGEVTGFAITRETDGPVLIGPIVAVEPYNVETLLARVGAAIGEIPAMVIVPGHEDAPSTFEAAGLVQQGEITRMCKGTGGPTLTGDSLRASAGFEYG